LLEESPALEAAVALSEGPVTEAIVARARKACESLSLPGPTWNAYGGHYFSPVQALAFDAMVSVLPRGATRSTLVAGILTAATRCAASPGHLAQPLQPHSRTVGYLNYYWKKDVFSAVEKAFGELAPRHARRTGKAHVRDAVHFAESVSEQDLVFVDPPYTGVHYSRFYHVLETMSTGRKPTVSGVGRYPERAERPRSAFSVTTESKAAVEELLATLSGRGATVIFTFPAGVCSNGLSGMFVRNCAKRYFAVQQHAVDSRFSTLGGRGANTDRKARRERKELILTMHPRA
jgi:hypothetical protein